MSNLPHVPRRHLIPSDSEPGRMRVVLSLNGVYQCSCPATVERCKHVNEAIKIEAAEKGLSVQEYIESMTNNQRQLVTREGEVLNPEDGGYRVSASRAIDRFSAERLDKFSQMAALAMKAGSDMLPANIKNADQAMLTMLAGDEWGFDPITSLRQVYVVNGKASLMTEGLLSLLHRNCPQIRVVWHHIGADGADVELLERLADGTIYPLVRYAYREEDRLRAHQGQKKGGGTSAREWLPKKDAQGKAMLYPMDYLRDVSKRGKPMYERNPNYDPALGTWEDDPTSPWNLYRPDMFAWAALKRAIKWGAPQAMNLPQPEVFELAPGDWSLVERRSQPASAPAIDYVPERTALAQAVASGEVPPATVLGSDRDLSDDEEPSYNGGDEDEGPDDDEEPPSEPEPTEDPDALPSADLVLAIKAYWDKYTEGWLPTRVGELVRELTPRYGYDKPAVGDNPAGRNLDFAKIPTAALARELLHELRVKGGDEDASGGPPA